MGSASDGRTEIAILPSNAARNVRTDRPYLELPEIPALPFKRDQNAEGLTECAWPIETIYGRVESRSSVQEP